MNWKNLCIPSRNWHTEVQLYTMNRHWLFFFLSYLAGKRWVECRDKGQISIPEKVDIETQVLDLSGNNLQILPREVFSRRGLLNLQKLFLSDCKLGQIDPTAFRGLTNLVELNLSGNLLTSVPTATFSGKKETQAATHVIPNHQICCLLVIRFNFRSESPSLGL